MTLLFSTISSLKVPRPLLFDSFDQPYIYEITISNDQADHQKIEYPVVLLDGAVKCWRFVAGVTATTEH